MKLDRDLTKKYRECFVEYRPIRSGEYILGIECVGDTSRVATWVKVVEMRVDILRAKKAGCRGAEEICEYLNGVR